VHRHDPIAASAAAARVLLLLAPVVFVVFACGGSDSPMSKPSSCGRSAAARRDAESAISLHSRLRQDARQVQCGDERDRNPVAVRRFALQIARAFGAQVTAVCSAAREELVRWIGALLVIFSLRGRVAVHAAMAPVGFAPPPPAALIAAGAFVALAAWMLIVGFKRLDPSLGIRIRSSSDWRPAGSGRASLRWCA
jgi:hypothetical protein